MAARAANKLCQSLKKARWLLDAGWGRSIGDGGCCCCCCSRNATQREEHPTSAADDRAHGHLRIPSLGKRCIQTFAPTKEMRKGGGGGGGRRRGGRGEGGDEGKEEWAANVRA